MTAPPSQFFRLGEVRLRTASGKALFGLDAEALSARMVEAGEPAWRGRQLAEALYRQRLADLGEITTLPKPLRQKLAAAGWQVGRPRIAQVFQSVDGTERYLIQCQSGGSLTVESVWMPEGDDGESGDGCDADDTEILGAPSFSRSSAERVGTNTRQKLGAPGLDSVTWETTNPYISGTNCAFSMLSSAISTVFTPVFFVLLFCFTAFRSIVIVLPGTPGFVSETLKSEATSLPCQCRLLRIASKVCTFTRLPINL